MSKSISRQEKIQQAIKVLLEFNIPHSSHNMGLHWKIPMEDYSIDLYPTTHSWYDPSMKKGGKGLESFLAYIGKLEPEVQHVS